MTARGRERPGWRSLDVPSRRGPRGEAASSGNQLEGGGVVRTNDAEVPSIERRDRRDVETFREGDQARVGATEPEVGIGLDQLGDSLSVRRRDELNLDVACCHGAKERCFCLGAELATDEIGGFGDHERSGEERSRALDRPVARLMVRVSVVGGREQNARVDDKQASVFAEAGGEEVVGVTGEPPRG